MELFANAKYKAAVDDPKMRSVTGQPDSNPAVVALMASPRRVYARDPVKGGVRGFVKGLAELLTMDNGEVAWADMQYVAFTLITVVNFAAQLLASPNNGLPPVPAALLTLMGVSAAAYTANKTVGTRGTNAVKQDSA